MSIVQTYLAGALVTNKLDYCNSRLNGAVVTLIDYTSSIQFGSYTRYPLSVTSHRLPIKFRIYCKIRIFTYKTHQTEQPSYFYNFMFIATYSLTLRLNQGQLLAVPKIEKEWLGHELLVIVPLLCGTVFPWQCVPPIQLQICFSEAPSTYLFGLAFPP